MSNQSTEEESLPIFPLLEIFGGALGILLLLIVILIFQQEKVQEEQVQPEKIGKQVSIKIDSMITGMVVSCHKDYLKIEQKDLEIPLTELNQDDNNRFIDYCREVYELANEKRICAFVYPESNDVIMRVEKILIDHVPKGQVYHFMVINDEIMDELKRLGDKYFN